MREGECVDTCGKTFQEEGIVSAKAWGQKWAWCVQEPLWLEWNIESVGW